jgi:hypothetical protein
MGRRLILSEEEKKTIQEMYGLINEQEYDSTVIDNKNPYRHKELLEFLRPYNKNLSNGEKFYLTKLAHFDTYINKEMIKSLNGKTVRLSDKLVYTLGKEYKVVSVPPSLNFIETLSSGGKLSNGALLSGSFSDPNTIGKNYDRMYIHSNGTSTLYNKEEGLEKSVKDNSKKEWIINMCNFIENEMRKIVENSPDEYWELREVNKKQTDFK